MTKLGRAAGKRAGAIGVLLAAAILSIGFARGAAAQASPDLNALIDDLVVANRILYHQGVLDGFGHVSVRDPANPAHFLMARALAPGRVTAADIVEFDLDGKPIDQRDPRSTYSERFIHAEIYRARADVNAVVHSHSPSVIPFSVTQVAMQPVATTASFLAAGVPVFDTRKSFGMTNMLISNGALGKALAETLGPKSVVVLLRGHGDAVVGHDLHNVVSRAVYTEINARLQMQAMMIGGPITFIAPEEAARMEDERQANVVGSGHGQDRTWEMWKAEAMGKPEGPARRAKE